MIKLPFYAKAALAIGAAYAFVYVLYLGQEIIVPIVCATIVAILLNPFVNFLAKRRIHKVVAISIAVVLVFVITACLVYFVSTQISMFVDTYPQLKTKTEATSKQAIQWISGYFNIKINSINAWITNAENNAFSDAGPLVGRTLLSLSTTFFVLLLMPVYLFMILFYKSLLLEFIRQLFKSEHRTTVVEVLARTKAIIQGYLAGLLIEALVIAILNSVALLVLGIDYAIILGITGALLNVIPYFGGVLAIALPMTIAFVTKDSISYPILVLGSFLIIQFIDNHYIIPSVVASKVKLNALVSIIAVLIGGALWGVPGMFLSIPLTAIAKVVFDHIENLKPWGYLLGNIVPSATRFSLIKPKKPLLTKLMQS
jgi:predicted PurR-regulated permease PerM